MSRTSRAQAERLRRRELVALAGGATAAVARPYVVRAEQVEYVRRVGVLMAYRESDPEGQALLDEFMQGLGKRGWNEHRNLRMVIRWAGDGADQVRASARELVDLRPDVILANATPSTVALQHETSSIPIVFSMVADPVGSRLVRSLARPGGNITGFTALDVPIVGKWLGFLKQFTPDLRQAAMMFNPDTAPYVKPYLLLPFIAAAQALNLATLPAPVRNNAEIEAVMAALARDRPGGLVVLPDNFVEGHRAPIISLAARNNVVAIYHRPEETRAGGLLSYGADFTDLFRRASGYVDSILHGARPWELPVQTPTKYLMVVNTRTARNLGLAVPPAILASADEVIS
jgi:putative tryptophan/tyrosine transport system substrate-binding protein